MSIISKKDNTITITPVGYSAQSVTGTCNIVQYKDTMFAVELGGIQEGHTALANYNLNKAQLNKIKPKLLQYIFVEHFHYDHVGLIPAAYAKGCTAQIIIPKGGTAILKEMWLDSAKIMQRDCETLSRKSGKNYQPFYDESDVFNTLSYITEYESNEIIILTDELSFRYLPAGHIMLSQQLELYIKLGMNTRKILFTSDLGNTITEKNRVFVEPFQPCDKAQIVIGESTYGLRDKRNGNKDLKNDLAKIKTVIEQFCVDNNRRVLFPTFSLDRTPIMLWYLYQIFGKDKSFKVPIIVDSPLAIRLLKHYRDILADYQDGRIELFNEMMSWENIQLITEYTDSEAAIKDNSGKVILAAGGMLQSGRSVVWAQHIIPCSNDCIAFCGYAGVDTLGYKIKHAKNQKTIIINNKTVANRCQVIELLSFSSHQQHNELVDYYSNITSDKIYLLHGDEQARIELKEDIQNELTKKCKSTKVSIVNKSTVIKL